MDSSGIDTKEIFGDETEFRRICNVHSDIRTGKTVLHVAAELGHFEICKFLIQNVKADVDVLTYEEDTPLILAAEMARLEIVKYLIEQGAAVGMGNSRGLTSLHHAVFKDNMQLIEFLVLKGAPIDADSVDGTPLLCAAAIGSDKAVKFLLSRGAEAKADPEKFLYGYTPLAYAAQEYKTIFLESLLKAGAKPDKLTTCFLKPIEVAALVDNFEGIRILLPLTQEIYPNWTVDGIREHFHSVETIDKREAIKRQRLVEIREAGKRAVSTRDYSSAIKLYSEAVYLESTNPIWLSNRSLCYARVGQRVHALRDAQMCVMRDPKWPKAHYREGCAWRLSKNYHKAAIAFSKAWKLAPEDKELSNVYKVAVLEYWIWLYLRRPKEMSLFFQRFL